MFINNSTYQILMEIPLDMVPRLMFVLIIVLLILFGLLFKINSTKDFIKSIFHKYIILVSILIIVWAFLIYFIFFGYMEMFYSTVVILLTIIFSTSILCFTAFKWVEDDSFLKNMVKDNFMKNSILGVVIGSFTSILSFNFSFIGIEFLKSLVLPLILQVLFLPMIYIIAVLNEYLVCYNLLPYSSEDYSIWDVFKKYTMNLHEIHRFKKQLNYKISSNKEIVLLDSGKSDFKLQNNCIYLSNELIGRYEYGVEIPKIRGRMIEAYTIDKNIPYIVGDYEIENFKEDMAFVYFSYEDMGVKLFVNYDCVPMHIWGPLIEDIFEFELLKCDK